MQTLLNRHRATPILIALTGLFFGGCASIVSGTKQKMTFNSDPTGATVSVNDQVIGVTPLEAKIKRLNKTQVTLTKEGYKPASIPLKATTNPMFFGNIVVGGLIGSTTDGASGAVNEYKPDHYLVTLEPQNASNLESKTSLSDEQHMRQFVVGNYHEVTEDIRRGSGEHLDSLLTLLKVAESDKKESIEKLAQLSQTSKTGVEFADHAATDFRP